MDESGSLSLLQEIRRSQTKLEEIQVEIQQSLNDLVKERPSRFDVRGGSFQEVCKNITLRIENDLDETLRHAAPKDATASKDVSESLPMICGDEQVSPSNGVGEGTIGSDFRQAGSGKAEASTAAANGRSASKTASATKSARITPFHNRSLTRSNTATKLQDVVSSSLFNHTISIAILCNAIVVGCEVDYRTAHVGPNVFYEAMQYIFFAVFSFELSIRLLAFRLLFFIGKDASWNLFDFVMVCLQVVEIVDTHLMSSITAEGPRRIFKLFRMFRVVRIFRVFRFSPQLRMMMFMILESVKSLGWLVCLLLSFLYVFSIVFTSGAIEYLGVPGTDDYHPGQKYEERIRTNYGSVLKSLYSCFRSMTGGQSWGELLDPLLDMEMGWFYGFIFILFILFAVLCFLNIVTGVFVDGALEKSKHDREMAVEKELSMKKTYVENLKQIFDDTDNDLSGAISKAEFEDYLKDDRVQAYFSSLRIDVSDVGELFDMLDRDLSGEIEFNEFIDNLLHLMRAQSPEQTVQKLLNENRKTARNLVQFIQYMGEVVDKLDTSLKSLPAMQREFLDEIELSFLSRVPDHMVPYRESPAPITRPRTPRTSAPITKPRTPAGKAK